MDQVPFWLNDPNILLNQKYILEFFPTSNMSFNEKLNAITRFVLFMTLVTMVIMQSARVVVGACLTLGAIALLHMHKHPDKLNEGFSKNVHEEPSPPARDALNENHVTLPEDAFDTPSSKNPFSNVLMTDYETNPNKRPAPPINNPSVQDNLLANAMRLVEEANPGQPDITEKLFGNLNEQLTFDQSMRQFTSNPSTTIPNDQGAFAEFCYGSMKSCKEGNLFACARNTSHYTLY